MLGHFKKVKLKKMSTIVLENKEEVIKKLTEIISNVAKESINNNGVFRIGVSGIYIMLQ